MYRFGLDVQNNLHSSIQVIRELVRYTVYHIHKMSDVVQLEVKIKLIRCFALFLF